MKLNARSHWFALLSLMMSVVPVVTRLKSVLITLITTRPAAGKLLVPIP
jgi:hypothetical protein